MWKYEFDSDNWDDVVCALGECVNILTEIRCGSIAEKYAEKIEKIEEEIENIEVDIEQDVEWASMPEDVKRATIADEEYAEAKEHWDDHYGY